MYKENRDTNSIQPIANSEFTKANASQLSFAKSYLRTTNALGVWPISAIFSVIAVGERRELMAHFMRSRMLDVIVRFIVRCTEGSVEKVASGVILDSQTYGVIECLPALTN